MKPNSSTHTKEHVFISYASVDRELALAVAKDVENLGHLVSIDMIDIEVGDSINDRIQTLIPASTLLIVIVSPASMKSHWVSFEIGLATAHKIRRIIPLLIHPSQELPGCLAGLRYAKSRDELCAYLSKQLPPGSPADRELAQRYEFGREKAHLLGSKLLGFYHSTLYANSIRQREYKNFPTEADIEANRQIREYIRNDHLTKSDGIISEEEHDNPKTLQRIIENHEYVWIIDPLDGTLNFAFGFPFFCISLGLLRHGVPTMGVIYSPTTQDLFCGLVGQRSQKINLSSGLETPLSVESNVTELNDCMVMMHLSTRKEPRRQTISLLDAVASHARGIRMLGSGQMALMALAESRFHVFFNHDTNIWDVVPGFVILRGAGGYCTTSLGKDSAWDWRSRGVIAAVNADIGEKFRAFISEQMPEGFPQL